MQAVSLYSTKEAIMDAYGLGVGDLVAAVKQVLRYKRG